MTKKIKSFQSECLKI